MKVFLDDRVHAAIDRFYDAALGKYVHTLSLETVLNRKRKIYAGIELLSNPYVRFRAARRRKDWLEKGYYEFSSEGFIFAYKVHTDENGEPYVWVYDAVHSSLYR